MRLRKLPTPAGSAVFALLWVVLAIARPTTTFHLAPGIVAASPAISVRQPKRAAGMAVAGLLIAEATTFVLSVTGLLRGPSLVPWGGPALESVIVAGIGASIGVLPSLVRREKTES